jgi:hypothetical protein
LYRAEFGRVVIVILEWDRVAADKSREGKGAAARRLIFVIALMDDLFGTNLTDGIKEPP